MLNGDWNTEETQDAAAVVPSRTKAMIWVWLVVPLALAFVLWLWHTQWACPWLTVRNAEGSLVFSSPLPEGQEFGIRFVHSVALSPVEEWFLVEDGQLALQRTVYQDFGAGLPHEAAEGQRMTFSEGQIVLSGFSLKLPQMDVRVGRVAEHQLLLAGTGADPRTGARELTRVFPLGAWASPGAALRFAAETPPLQVRLLAYFQ